MLTTAHNSGMAVQRYSFFLSFAVFLVAVLQPAQSSSIPSSGPCPNRCFRSFRLASDSCRPFRRNRPSLCAVRRCMFNRQRNQNGFICTEASPSPSPSPSTEPSPSPAVDFRGATFMASIEVSDDRIEAATDGSATLYRMSYNATLAAGGVVSLDGVANFTTVTCDPAGSVRIRLGDGAPATSSLSNMYPEGAILIISRELFGECLLGPPLVIPDETEEDRNLRFSTQANGDLSRDAFLIIESVSGSPSNAEVRGSATSFFAVFDEAQIVVEVANPTVRDFSAAGNLSKEANLPVSSRGLTVNLQTTVLSAGPLQLTLSGTGEVAQGFTSFTADWNLSGVNIEFKFTNQLRFTLEAELRVGIADFSAQRVVNLLSVPIYGVPAINLFRNVGTGPFSIPKFRLGFFFEVPLIFSANTSVQTSLSSKLSAMYSTPTSEITLFARGPYTNIDFGSNTRTISGASRSFDFMPAVVESNSAPAMFRAFVGVRPQVSGYVPIFFARTSVDVGVSATAVFDAAENSAFLPFSGPGSDIGRCDECHDLRISAEGQVRNARITGGIDISIDVKIPFIRRNVTLRVNEQVTLPFPGNPSLTRPIATACFFEPISSNGTAIVFQASENICAACPENRPMYNPTRQECEGECDEDEPFFNQATETCEPCPPETPVFNEDLEICEGSCPGGTRAGNNIPFFGSFELGAPNGTFIFEYEHFTIRDRSEVIYEGEVIFDTGCTGGSASVPLSYSGNATNVVVNVTPNCAGTSGTAWNFDVSCPT